MLQYAKKALGVTALLGAFALGGAALANATSSPSTTTSNQGGSPPAFNGPAHGTAAHEDAEKPVTGAAADKAKAAAIKALGGGTATEVTTDYTQNGYEVEVTKADGSKTEVHLDSSFQAMPGPGVPHGAPGTASGTGPSGPPPSA